MPIKGIIGQVATGGNFFPRDSIVEEIWTKIEAGSNLLLVAPRRVGKSSILYYLLDNPKENLIVLYFTSESVNNENEFYRKLYNHIVDKLSGMQRYMVKVQSLTKNLISRIETIGTEGITIGENKISYLNELQDLIENISLDKNKIVILIDEFAQTVENIIRDEGENSAIHFLESKREIRQARKIQNRLQFVYAGSIGLENIVSRINKTSTINDLASVSIPPLTKSEARLLVAKILNDSKIELSEEIFEYLLQLIEWLIPFYFQLIIDEAYKILCDEKTQIITKEIIEKAVNNSLRHKNYFDPWYQRLRIAYKGEEFSFVKELLCSFSEKQTMQSNEIINMAVRYKLESSYTDLLNALKYDGYINNNDDPKIYRFNSPLLRKWWYCNVAN